MSMAANDKKSTNVFPISEGLKKILEKIEDPQIKVVSFDIFDTLLFRPVSNPTDIFRLLENKLNIQNFHNMRVTAEAEARRYKKLSAQDITLEDIYEMYAQLFGASPEEITILKQEELDMEYKLLYARKSAKFLFERAKAAGKELIIISDMYLSSEFLNRCLQKNGYRGYSNLYVSSETGMLKSTKMMFQFVISELSEKHISPSEVLHIGDNKKADVDCAIASGINAMHLPKPADLRGNCKHLKRLYNYILGDVLNSNNAILYGFLINLYFDDPFVDFEKASFFNGDARLMGYWFSPLLIGFTKWMIETVEQEHIEQLLFVWRDGYLPSKLFQIMRPFFTKREIEVHPIYMGRALRVPYQSLERNGFFTSFADYPLRENATVDFFIKRRLFCTNEEQRKKILDIFFRHGYINGNTPIGKFEKYRGFCHELEPFYIENSKNKIRRYSKYIESQIKRGKKTAIFDRSPRGKSSRFLKQFFNIQSDCITTEIYDVPKAKLMDTDLSVKSYLEYGSYYINKMGRIWAMLFERIISDTAPGFEDITENPDGTVSVLLDIPKDDEIMHNADIIVQTIQNAILDFVKQFTDTLGEYLPYVNIDRHGVFDYTIDVLSVPHIKDAELIVKINPDKSTLAPIDENTFINWYNSKFKRQMKMVTPSENTFRFRIKLKGYLLAEQLGILPQARAVYRFIARKPQQGRLSVETVQAQTDEYIKRLDEIGRNHSSVVLVVSVPTEAAKLFNGLAQLCGDFHFIFSACGFLRCPTCFDFPCLEAPNIFGFWGIEGADKELHLPEVISQEVKGKPYLWEVVKRRMSRGYSKSAAILIAFEAERYFNALIDALSPKTVIVWNHWGNNSSILAEIARQRHIPVIAAERGFIEGTLMLSRNGYGRDQINTNFEQFVNLSVDPDDLNQAQGTIEFLQKSGFNRYTQPVGDSVRRLKERLNNGKPNILFVGSFDCENPAFPFSEASKKDYSPIFETSIEAVSYVAALAKKNQWNIIFKPHPLMDRFMSLKDRKKIPSDINYIREANINELIDLADVVICMISGVSYIALTRGKALVELAYTPLRGKGCCYEAFEQNSIETAIQNAVKHGFTQQQRQAFMKHIAQVNKYYFFDDLGVRPIRYGRPLEEAAHFLLQAIKEKTKEDDCNENGSMGSY